jgi:hypothetical protein
MSMRSFVLVLLASGACAGAQADDEAVVQQVRCARDYAPAQACRFSDRVGADGTHTMEFSFGDQRVRFVGRSQTGWWSGRLDGQPAMGYEIDRGHTVYSTVDLKTAFEWWSDGGNPGAR